VRSYAARQHRQVCADADREMYLGTYFLRNRPELELIRRLAQRHQGDEPLRIAVLGCSIGVEVYSILWTLRRDRPDRGLIVHGVDTSPDVLQVAERGVYGPQATELVRFSIFADLTPSEREAMFDWDGDEGEVKSWLRDGITWELGDASDPGLVARLGPH